MALRISERIKSAGRGCRAVWQHVCATWTWRAWLLLGLAVFWAAWYSASLIFNPGPPAPTYQPVPPADSSWVLMVFVGLVVLLWERLKEIPEPIWFVLVGLFYLHGLLKDYSERREKLAIGRHLIVLERLERLERAVNRTRRNDT